MRMNEKFRVFVSECPACCKLVSVVCLFEMGSVSWTKAYLRQYLFVPLSDALGDGISR